MTDETKKKKKKKKKSRKKRRKQFLLGLIFLLGLLVLLYPQFSRWYYRVEANEQVASFEQGVAELSPEEIEERLALARAYNDSLNNVVSEDPYAENRLAQGRAEYARMLEVHEKIGVVEIPKINEKLPIYAGTAEEVLQKGVGHLEGTSLPIGGNSTHAVLTAHSGLPTAKLFTDLEKMEIGDKFYVHNVGGILAYQVDQIKVIEPTDFSDLLIVPGHDYVTLLTCTPLMVNTHRLLVRGHQVEYIPAVDEALIAENAASFMYKYLFFISLALILLLLIVIYYLRKKRKKMEWELKEMKKQEQELTQAKAGKEVPIVEEKSNEEKEE
ncbi:class C sortase [Peptoniphilus sp. KCTC 25270]|uniref:class C sortase n=1 Tax=Peptoniphilus sp. KCTC 25270 TaxID=2897414 RepID=UPI001E65DEB2|nr:class C sortase [Peptoniphilus sp. KCTC 25270]MCD1147747.1 class C sortase [Peptoniphilus sp. KCTC 25270]